MSHITRRAFLASPAVAAPSLSARAAEKRLPFVEPVAPPRRVQVVAHRGLTQLAPENTRFAVEACAGDLVEWAEIGVRLTSDGKHVTFHDDRLEGKTDGSGLASGFTLDQLQKLDAGTWFAPRFAGARLLSLSEALALAKGKVNLSLDCESIDPELLVREVRAAGMEQQVVVLGTSAALATVRKASRGAVSTIAKYRSR